MKSVFGRVENIVGKGQNAGYQSLIFSGSLEVAVCGKELNSSP